MSDESEPTPERPRRRLTGTHVPFQADVDDFFQSHRPAWMKVIGCAIAVPILFVIFSGRGDASLPSSPFALTALIVGAAIVGGIVGGLLALKDWVQANLAAGKPVPWACKLLFGYGMWSLLFVWVPLAFVLTFVGLIVVAFIERPQ